MSLVLLAILSLALLATFQFGSLSLARTGPHAAGTAAVASTQTSLRRWLEAAYPEYVPPPVPGLAGHIIFDGEPSTITFLTPAPMSMLPGGLALMQLRITGTPGSESLAVIAQPELAWPDAHQQVQETLLTGFATAQFAFWGQDNPATPPYWHETWSAKQVLPRLIRVQLVFKPGDLRHWPDMLIAPEIRTDVGCVFSQMLNGCVGRQVQ